MNVYPNTFDSAEVKGNFRNLPLEKKSRVRLECYYQSLLYTWAMFDDTCSLSRLVTLSK